MQHDYEMLLMLDPELSEDRQEQIVVRTRELVEGSGGTWVGHDPWGRRRLAYPIDKQTDGIYHLVQFDAEPAALDELTRVLKITDGVMRQLPTRRVKGGHAPGRPGPEPPIDADRTPGYAGANVRSQEASTSQEKPTSPDASAAEEVGAAEQDSDAGESPAAEQDAVDEQSAVDEQGTGEQSAAAEQSPAEDQSAAAEQSPAAEQSSEEEE